MKKINQKGFALVETLIVATFVMGIFTLILTNYFPMMGEYEKRERYDDVDSVYHTYLLKKMLENPEAVDQVKGLTTGIDRTNGVYNGVNCSIYDNTDFLDYCQNLYYNLNVYSIFVTSYNIKNLKKKSLGNRGLEEYIDTLPNYEKNPKNYTYRIIVQFKRVVNSESGEDSDSDKVIYSYSTIGVDL